MGIRMIQESLFPLTFREIRQVQWEEGVWYDGVNAPLVNRRRITYPPMTYRFGSVRDVVGWMRNQFDRGFAKVDDPTEPFEYSMTKVGDLEYVIVLVQWSDW